MRLNLSELASETGLSINCLKHWLSHSEFNSFYQHIRINKKSRAIHTYEYNKTFKQTLLHFLEKKKDKTPFLTYQKNLH